MPTRPCAFCLCLQEGSVFADFDVDDAGVVSLRRISFDGYGCCRLGGDATMMSSDDSRLLVEAVRRGDLGGEQVERVLRTYIRANADVIWRDALEDNELL
ncbi:MAG: hypothetical protein ACAI43_00515 [Phycisphaerae bacterium]|nr:hypothetical protein [Tepidisphaeraceae bacterium]